MRLSGGPRESRRGAYPRTADDEAGWTRAELLRRAAGGGAGLFLLGGGMPVIERLVEAEPALAAPVVGGGVHQFVSRPDLVPPVISVLRSNGSAADGYIFLAPSSGPGHRGTMIIDDAGDVVWFHRTKPKSAMDFRMQIYKGKPVLTWWEGKFEKGIGQVGDYVVFDDTYREIARFRASNDLRADFHEYLLTPEGTALVTSHSVRSANLSSVGGPSGGRVLDGVIQELEIPSGRVLWEWHSFDYVGVDESYQTEIGNPYDYFHVNSVGLAADGNLIVSARNTWAVYKVNRRTGNVIWRLGGRKSDFAMGKGTLFAFQHDARLHNGGRVLSVFDNGPHPQTKPQSRGLILSLDAKRRRASLLRELRHSPLLFARVTGNTQFLPNGDVLVCYGSTGYFTEFDVDGKVRLDAKLPDGGQNYRVKRLPWTGRPKDPPELATRVASGGETIYVSWNGATEVASWHLRSGPSPTRLSEGATMPKDGFETAFPVPAGARYVDAIALDEQGNPLGQANPIRI